VPGDLIAPGPGIRPPFSLGSSPASMKADASQSVKPTALTGAAAFPKTNEKQPPKAIAHTRGVAVPTGNQRQGPRTIPRNKVIVKKLEDPETFSKTTAAKAKFSGAEALAPLANKKRPLTAMSADEDLQQGNLPVLKKARKENETALPELPKNVLEPNFGEPSSNVSSAC